MDRSTIYIKCPQCRETGLLIERQGKYFCANCMYDYALLKDDDTKLDEVLIENLRIVSDRCLPPPCMNG